MYVVSFSSNPSCELLKVEIIDRLGGNMLADRAPLFRSAENPNQHSRQGSARLCLSIGGALRQLPSEYT
jgi:hypothetical protein